MNMNYRRLHNVIYLVFIGIIARPVSAAEAISEPDTSVVKRKTIVIVKKPSDQNEAQGLTVGSFTLLPEVSLTEYYDDNVYGTETNTKSDFVTVIAPSMNLKSNWKQHALGLSTGIEVIRYLDLDTENTTNGWFDLNGKYEFNKTNALNGGFSYTRNHEDRASPDARAGTEPTRFDETTANLGYSWRTGSHFVRLILNNTKINFFNVNSSLGVINNDDRDRVERTAGLRYLYKYSPGGAVFLDSIYDNRDYDQTPDNLGNDRNSTGYRFSSGVELVGTNTVSKIALGRLGRDYKSAVFDNVAETYVGLYHQWKFQKTNQLVFRVHRSIEETTLDSSPGYLLTDASLTLNFSLPQKQDMTLGIETAKADYYGVVRTDDYADYRVGYGYAISSRLKFSADIKHAIRDSSASGEDYKINQFFVRIKASL